MTNGMLIWEVGEKSTLVNSILNCRWLGVAISCTGCLATAIAAILAVYSSSSITAGMAALSVVYAHYVSSAKHDIASDNIIINVDKNRFYYFGNNTY